MRKRYGIIISIVLMLGLALVVSACAGQNDVVEILTNGGGDAGVNNANGAGSVENDVGDDAGADSSDAPDPVPPPPGLAVQPVERQAIFVVTEDGRTLEGYYYPAAVSPAPVIVMMHWAPGTYEDWQAIAPWLQNRGNAEPRMPVVGCTGDANDFVIGPWLDEAWFPVLPEDVSFGVVVFNFGGCGKSEAGGTRESKLLDAKAAVLTASRLPGVDASRISTLGASVGADGAPDGCWLFNRNAAAGMAMGECIGAFSLSPGDYLTLDYGETIGYLQNFMIPSVPVVCLAAESDGASPATCLEGEGESYTTYIYAGLDHGMKLLDPAQTPKDPVSDLNALELYLEFLELVYGVVLLE